MSRVLYIQASRGGEYLPGTDAEAFDLQKRYIELIFGFMGFSRIESVVVEPTLQGGPEVAQRKLAAAVGLAGQAAAAF